VVDQATEEEGQSAEDVQVAQMAQGTPHEHWIKGREGTAHALVAPDAPIGQSPPSDSNGITPHGGPVMSSINVYYIWYGNWAGNTAQTILTDLASSIGGSPYWNINTTYYDPAATHVTSAVRFAGSTTDAYSRGVNLTDVGVQGVVSDAITSGRLPRDTAGVYFVLTSPDVTETSGFCTAYCGWHTFATIAGSNIKYSFVGDAATRCPGACMAQSNGPNNNGGADGMASVIAHELEEAAADPNLNAWFDSTGEENADKCAWTFGAEHVAPNGTLANIHLGGRDYLIQQNWVNATGGYCSMASNYESLGGVLSSSPAVSSWAPGRLDMFARGSDNALWHRFYDAGWSGWESLGGTLNSEPAAVSWSSGRIDVFWRGTDNALWHEWFAGAWFGPESLGGTLTSGPAVASWAPGRLDVFARGADNALWHMFYDAGWSGWESLGGGLSSEPAAVSWASGRLDVFARGTDNALWHMFYDAGWSGWESLGGTLASGPAAASWAAGRLDVFARSTDNTLLHKFYGGSWSGFESLGNTTLSSPAAVSWSAGRIDVFTVGESSAAWHKWFDGSHW
jgi:hypothetical protein